MPKLRGAIATPEVKAEWTRAYELYLKAPVTATTRSTTARNASATWPRTWLNT